ncbi:MAG: DUF6787 family protein [Candidatus Kapaibacterium sp.]
MLDKIRKYFREKWGIKSGLQLFLILAAFGLAGSSTLFLNEFVTDFLNIGSFDSLFMKVLIWLLIFFPLYHVTLLFYGLILGQIKFFLNFEKQSIGRFGKLCKMISSKMKNRTA